MKVPIEKPGTPAELVHAGVKGMKWGVRKEQVRKGYNRATLKKPRTPTEQAKFEHRKAVAKKVAIGTAALLVVAGTAYVAYRIHQNGKTPIHLVKPPTKKTDDALKKILSEQTEILHFARQKERGLRFFKSGGVPNPIEALESAIPNDARAGYFAKLPDGRIGVRMPDPHGRADHAGRPIVHDIVIPKIRTIGINSVDDVRIHLWPELAKHYDPGFDLGRIE